MNGFEITELAQVSEQENMLERAERQALRRAERERGRRGGALLQPGGTLRRRR